MTATMAERITFNQLTAEDFKDSQVVSIKREIRQLAAAFVTIPGGAPEALRAVRAKQIAMLAIFMTTGVKWDSLAPEFLDSLTGYADSSLEFFAGEAK